MKYIFYERWKHWLLFTLSYIASIYPFQFTNPDNPGNSDNTLFVVTFALGSLVWMPFAFSAFFAADLLLRRMRISILLSYGIAIFLAPLFVFLGIVVIYVFFGDENVNPIYGSLDSLKYWF
jgi:hypothetical protein